MHTSFEMMRHGHKQGEGLSQLGVEQAGEKAREIYNKIKALPEDAVVCLFSSNIGRAIATKDTIENELLELVKSDAEIQVLSVQSKNAIENADPGKKIVIIDTAPQTRLGIKIENHPTNPAFNKYRSIYKSEDIAGQIWIARKGELPELKSDLEKQFPDIDSSDIKPSEFNMTPEEFGMDVIRFYKRMTDLSKKYFPGRPVDFINVSHNYNGDFALFALMDQPLNLATLKDLGGTFRDFVESSEVDIKDDEIVVKYRGKTIKTGKSLQEILDFLKESANARKIEWAEE